jgi:hypothetical protein
MLNDSISTNSVLYSSSNNNETLRLSTDSDQDMDYNNNQIAITNKNIQTSSGRLTRSKKAVNYI